MSLFDPTLAFALYNSIPLDETKQKHNRSIWFITFLHQIRIRLVELNFVKSSPSKSNDGVKKKQSSR